MNITGLPEGYSGYAVLEGWTLDVTNKSTKLLHDVTGYGAWFGYFNTNATATNSNRFVAAAEPYRIYWSVDGNYDGSNYGTADPNTPTDTRYSQEFNYIADIEDEDGTINYQCVYSGVNGPVPTRASELIREGVQDYRLMQLLKAADPSLYAQLQREYLEGNRDFDSLKARALDRLLAVEKDG